MLFTINTCEINFKNQNILTKRQEKQLEPLFRKTWGDLVKSGEKIAPNSELGERTMKQFKDWISIINLLQQALNASRTGQQ